MHPARFFAVALTLLCLAGTPASALMIRDYGYPGFRLSCDILWGPDTPAVGSVGGEIWIDDPDANPTHNGAWIHVEALGDALFVRTADGDTDGHYGPDATDWFAILQTSSDPFLGSTRWVFNGHNHQYWIAPLDDTPWGLRLFAEWGQYTEPPQRVPDGTNTALLLMLACGGMAMIGRSRIQRHRSDGSP